MFEDALVESSGKLKSSSRYWACATLAFNLSLLAAGVLRSSALDAVRQWRYQPYLLNHEPTAVETTITVRFSLDG